ncbi:Alpha/Beta hydrolase protein [Ilyonectria destructans]|nr:Alpha/Beta hydrolase protein [Ilyonectria destructans]
MTSFRLLAMGLAVASFASANELQTVTDFGPVYNTSLKMQIYVPEALASSPPIVLALHGCFGSGDQYFAQAGYDTYAESLGALLIFPTSQKDSNCWDVSSDAVLSHNKHADNEVLVNMIDYTIKTYNADPSRVFVTGTSSGCMMTNVLCATYPDVFAAATCYSGVAAGCFAGSPGSSPISSNRSCANGDVQKTGEEWAAQAHAMYPGYSGDYPSLKTWHGTADSLVFYQNLKEQIKLWTTIIGLDFSYNETSTPEADYTTMVFGDGTKFEAVSAVGVGHTVPIHQELDFKWFGLL